MSTCSPEHVAMDVQSSLMDNHPKVETTQMSSTGKGTNRRWYAHIVEYYTAVKKNRLLICATSWRNSFHRRKMCERC